MLIGKKVIRNKKSVMNCSHPVLLSLFRTVADTLPFDKKKKRAIKNWVKINGFLIQKL